nr:zinc finger, CCHC-type [Tanacetum cinerariifolium]
MKTNNPSPSMEKGIFTPLESIGPVEPWSWWEDHTFEVEPLGNIDHVVGSKEVQTQDLIYYHSARDKEQHSAWELFNYREDNNEAAFAVAAVGMKDDMDSRSDVYVLSNGCMKCSDENDGYYWEYTPGVLDQAKVNVLGMKIVRDQSGNTFRVSQSKFYNEKLVQTLFKGHFILSLDGSLSGDCDVEKNDKLSCICGSQEYQVVCTRLDIASADVGYDIKGYDKEMMCDLIPLTVNF